MAISSSMLQELATGATFDHGVSGQSSSLNFQFKSHIERNSRLICYNFALEFDDAVVTYFINLKIKKFTQ